MGGQPINAYANVTAISGGSMLTIASVNQSYHTFQVGKEVIVMQMQDSVISSNSNSSSFGNIGSIRNAGHFEVGLISAISPATGTPTMVTLAAPLTYTYNICNNCNVQLISFHNFGTTYSLTSYLTTYPWNGTIGGVFALKCGNLILNTGIDAGGTGFQGAVAPIQGTNAVCTGTNYAVSTTSIGIKGEGIFRRTAAYQKGGRAHIATGGGGGTENMGGGGGGGNYSNGGNGGVGSGCTSSNSGAGMGGVALSSYISPSRIFMGGGGGSGQWHTSFSNGEQGGGIIIISADTLITQPGCYLGVYIIADGYQSYGVNYDAAGGGGAGGTILLQISAYKIDNNCPIYISANGGDGGYSYTTSPVSDSGGGGGGQGAIIFSASVPTQNVVVETKNGIAVVSNPSVTPSSTDGGNSNNAGIISLVGLPIKLEHFSGGESGSSIILNWVTINERNTRDFMIEKMIEDRTFFSIGKVEAAHFSLLPRSYRLTDELPFVGYNYYRLIEFDVDGSRHELGTIAVKYAATNTVRVYPNPIQAGSELKVDFRDSQAYSIIVHDIMGNVIFSGDAQELARASEIFAPGIYLLSFPGSAGMKPTKIVVQR